jgi:quercetin dioxygenase-like cupin family protein
MSTLTPTVPFSVHAGEEEAIWFFGSLVTIKASGDATGGRIAVLEHLSPRGSGSPLHVHHNEDEMFYVIDGELTLWVNGQTTVAPAGSFAYGPRDVPHTFAVTSDQARFLLIAQPAGFDDFVRAIGEPAQQLVIPPPATEPPDMAALAAIAAQHGIELLGPPGIPD